jgi:excinuclease ABC subunit A
MARSSSKTKSAKKSVAAPVPAKSPASAPVATASPNSIRLRNVRQNNLKGFDLDLPLGKLIVITGLSGSGKSSLAFETLYAEGQRRYIETFTPYARQFFDRMDKPAVDRIENIPPAIAIEQRNAVRSTRSTVGTMTEVCDHLKVLWPHLAQLHCRKCGQVVRCEPPQAIWEEVQSSKFKVQSPAEGELKAKQGVSEVRMRTDTSPSPGGKGRGEGGPATGAKSEVGSRKLELSDAASETLPPSAFALPTSPEVLVTFDLPLSDKLPLTEQLTLLSKQGFQRLLLGDQIVRVDEALRHSSLASRHSLTVVADRVKLIPENRPRFIEACEQAYHFGRGRLAVRELSSGALRHPSPVTRHFSSGFHCAACDLDYKEPTPALFSFNNPVGACPACRGFGRIITIDPDLALPDRSKTLAEGVVKPWQTETGKQCQDDLVRAAKKRGVPMHVPFNQLSAEHQRWVMQGEDGYIPDDPDHSWPKLWYGVKGYFRWLESKAYKMHVRVLLSRYRSYKSCPDCGGKRFNAESLAFRLKGRSNQCSVVSNQSVATSAAASLNTDPLITDYASLTLADFYALPIRDALALVERLTGNPKLETRNSKLPNDPLAVALHEVRARLGYLVEVGLGYLTLDRTTRTLSGGETERVNLTTCLGTRLTNTLFVLDEPSVGLHPRDTDRLVRILHRLRDAGNTVVVVEHEASVMRAADQIVDLGPGHGETGGRIVFQGTPSELTHAKDSLTAAYLTGRKRIELPKRRSIVGHAASRPERTRNPATEPQGHELAETAFAADTITPYRTTLPAGRLAACPTLRLTHATAHNLRDVSVEIPLGRLVCVTGVSGSGKTTLVREVLVPLLQTKLSNSENPAALDDEVDGESRDAAEAALSNAALAGWETLGSVVLVDQSPIGRTPRSNPAVYIGAFDDIRDFFAASEEARERGLAAGAFSFNSAQGQCERCRGAGFEKIEMQFLSDVFIRCPACQGRRYREHILEIKVQGPKSKVRSLEGGEAQTKGADAATLGLEPQTLDSAWSIADLLEAPIEDAVRFLRGFADSKPAQRAARKLELLCEVGLGYLRVGQPINTLSGGESQRLKLVSHLAESAATDSKLTIPPAVAARLGEATLARLGAATRNSKLETRNSPRPTLFLFDEPTTGLHFDDVRVLLAVFQRLVDAGHSVLVIEHNLDVIKCADWIIDLGPDAGDEGGRVVACGTPEEVAECDASHTARFLSQLGVGASGCNRRG